MAKLTHLAAGEAFTGLYSGPYNRALVRNVTSHVILFPVLQQHCSELEKTEGAPGKGAEWARSSSSTVRAEKRHRNHIQNSKSNVA